MLPFLSLVLGLAVIGTASATATNSVEYWTAYNYTVRFYPVWVTSTQFKLYNSLISPAEVTPLFRLVVAPNADTVYTSAVLRFDEVQGPLILTIPAYPNTYSILQLDVFGTVYKTNLIPKPEGGAYVLYGPNTRNLPPPGNTTAVKYATNTLILIFRADKNVKGVISTVEVTPQALQFRKGIRLQTLADSKSNPGGGNTTVAPPFFFSLPLKSTAADTIQFSTTSYLRQLQKFLTRPFVNPLSSSDNALIASFNKQFAAAQPSVLSDGVALQYLTEGARAAFKAFNDRWVSNTGPTNWVHFDNIGRWGTAYLDRAAATEFIQLGNDATTAWYAFAFSDTDAIPLNGGRYNYTLTFAKSELPDAKRFWSLTAYTVTDLAFIPNAINKYNVASYTPDLTYNTDGSLTLYLSITQATNGSLANWLPVHSGPFTVVLRIYGPQGAVANNTYSPPAIQRVAVA